MTEQSVAQAYTPFAFPGGLNDTLVAPADPSNANRYAYAAQLALPGVPEAWTFYPSQDLDGRNRWNVYPLNGAPDSAIDYGGDLQNGSFPLVAGAELQQPPIPFAKAPEVTQLTRD
ncbi:hypothetical protein [Cellulomonas sp. RIT-PI-Y]|uniref:hypothetical protein n=1 Tax=Cellulomonas sp. RIT-PI-Y TaxID=3035297 RepID=UPI0021DA6ABD|nr:hypothetical protein [Cellulomonas sp. RIT-PI-Y]